MLRVPDCPGSQIWGVNYLRRLPEEGWLENPLLEEEKPPSLPAAVRADAREDREGETNR